MAAHERMADGAGLDGVEFGGRQRLIRVGNDRQHRAGEPLAADVKDRLHVAHPRHPGQFVSQLAEGGERGGCEEVARAARGPHDAVAVGPTKPGGNLVDPPEIVSRISGIDAAEERPQIVIDPQSGDADPGQDGAGNYGKAGRWSPGAGGAPATAPETPAAVARAAGPTR